MATIDVLDASNWDNVYCRRVDLFYTQNYYGWSGSYWKSEGAITFDDCLSDEGKIVTGVQIDLDSRVNPEVVWPPPNVPWVTVKTSGAATIANEQIDISGSQLISLSYYDHEQWHIDEITVVSLLGWSIYEYSGNELNEPVPNYFLDILGLSLVYQLPSSHARWQDYRKTYEIETGA